MLSTAHHAVRVASGLHSWGFDATGRYFAKHRPPLRLVLLALYLHAKHGKPRFFLLNPAKATANELEREATRLNDQRVFAKASLRRAAASQDEPQKMPSVFRTRRYQFHSMGDE